MQRPFGLRVLYITTEDSLPLSALKPLTSVMSGPLVRTFEGRYGVLDGVPTNYVIDRKGVLRYAKAAAFDVDSMNDLLVPLLQEPAPSDPDKPTGPSGGSSKPLAVALNRAPRL